MGDSYSDPAKRSNSNNDRNFGRAGFQGGRNAGNQSGGFRIRLSDNEMKASKAIQEAFNLRSTVAVLGFATRTLGQMLDEGKLNEIITEHRANASNNNNKSNSTRRTNKSDQQGNSGSKPDPFARPPKPESSPNQDSQDLPEETTTITTEVDEDIKQDSNEQTNADLNNDESSTTSNT